MRCSKWPWRLALRDSCVQQTTAWVTLVDATFMMVTPPFPNVCVRLHYFGWPCTYYCNTLNVILFTLLLIPLSSPTQQICPNTTLFCLCVSLYNMGAVVSYMKERTGLCVCRVTAGILSVTHFENVPSHSIPLVSSCVGDESSLPDIALLQSARLTKHVLLCSMDQVKGVLTLQGEALTQAVSFSLLSLFSSSSSFGNESLILLFNRCLFKMCDSSYQDINLKIAKNSQALHFQFREDKQWKLQQVIVAPCEKSRDEDGSGGLECLIQVFLTCVFITAVHIKRPSHS